MCARACLCERAHDIFKSVSVSPCLPNVYEDKNTTQASVMSQLLFSSSPAAPSNVQTLECLFKKTEINEPRKAHPINATVEHQTVTLP